MRKIHNCLEVKTVLELECRKVGEGDIFPCVLHKGKESYMKWYRELNAVACINPNCSCYQQVYTPLDLLQVLGGRTKTEAKELAELLLIEELEEYRREARGGDKYEEEEDLKPFVLSEGARDFLIQLSKYLERTGSPKFKKKDVFMALDIKKRTLNYYLKILQEPGYIEVMGGNRHIGYIYEFVRLPED
jgi:hypothetical protein